MGIAVLTRNHSKYLRSAAKIGERDPNQLITFRAEKAWKKAKEAIVKSKTIPIYFVPIDGGSDVTHEAILSSVHLYPKKGDGYTDKILGLSLDETRTEDLWGDKVNTLYTVRGCKRLEKPFSMTELIKESNGKPVDKDYHYSYALTYPHEPLSTEDVELAPEELQDPKSLYEGAKRTVAVNAYERNPRARRECIRHYDHRCHACGLVFEEMYGDIGKGYIQVHHRKPMASVTEKYKVNPIKDLIPVCPNCHAMIHRKDPPLTVEEVAALIRTRSGK